MHKRDRERDCKRILGITVGPQPAAFLVITVTRNATVSEVASVVNVTHTFYYYETIGEWLRNWLAATAAADGTVTLMAISVVRACCCLLPFFSFRSPTSLPCWPFASCAPLQKSTELSFRERLKFLSREIVEQLKSRNLLGCCEISRRATNKVHFARSPQLSIYRGLHYIFLTRAYSITSIDVRHFLFYVLNDKEDR